MDNTQSVAELRRSWMRGVRPEDADQALDELEQRGEELQAQIAASRERARDLAERVLAAEERLLHFHASFEHAGTLISLAEARARDAVSEAEGYSLRVDSAAGERIRAEEAEIAALEGRRRATVGTLAELGSGLTTLGDEPAAADEAPAPRRVTVADLLALEAEGRL